MNAQAHDRHGACRRAWVKPDPRSEKTSSRPLVLITGAAGNLGRGIANELSPDYQVIGLDRVSADLPFPLILIDLSSEQGVRHAFDEVERRFGRAIAAVIHLAAYFDMSGQDDPKYEVVNIEGTRRLVHALRRFDVERFVYASTMLVHVPAQPGERIDEDSPFGPLYVYPQSKLAAEEVIRSEHGDMPYAILRLAGVYDTQAMVPTLAQQFARIYERDLESHLYSGSLLAGQAMLHRADMLAAFRQTIAARATLPEQTVLLIGEEDAMGYANLQDMLGKLIHGRDDWRTLQVPKSMAAAGSWLQAKAEPVVPDAFDQGEKPFIRPYMVRMADAHYALDTRRARDLIGWQANHGLADELPAMVAALKNDPPAWYAANGITPPPWLAEADERVADPEALRTDTEATLRDQLRENRWAHLVNIGLGTWLITQPPLIGVTEPLLRASEIGLGLLVMVFAALSLSRRLAMARWITAALGALVMAAPFMFWTQNAAAYLSDTLVGMLIFGFAVCTRPEPGTSLVARMTGPDIPAGWSFNPSSWIQRLPIIVLAFVGLYVSRYLAAYQLEHVDSVWEPFFAGSPNDPRNGTEEIITSSVSEAWPVPDAALGAYTYALEILTGIVGSRARWRTMPWVVMLFGLMIVPLGIVSITFIIIQPIIIGTWSTLALIAAAAMLVQIPYSIDELLATTLFLRRRVKAGRSFLRVFLFGDTDDGGEHADGDEFARSGLAVWRDMWTGGVNLPWNLALATILGLLLMFSRLTVDASGGMANADHLMGSLVLTVVALSAAEPFRILRFALLPIGFALCITPMVYGADIIHLALNIAIGLALVGLCIRRGRISERYGRWSRFIV